jgi:hypothetical protein
MTRQDDATLLSCPLEPDGLPAYEMDDTQLEVGSGFGNRKCWIDTKGTGDVEHLFSVELGMAVAGALVVRYARLGRRLALPESADCEGAELRAEPAYALLAQGKPGTFTIHPAYQAHTFEVSTSLAVHEAVFTQKTGSDADCPSVYVRTRLGSTSRRRCFRWTRT